MGGREREKEEKMGVFDPHPPVPGVSHPPGEVGFY